MCYFFEIGGPQEVPHYLYSVAKFVIIFLRYLLELFFFLSNAKFSFAIFAEFVDCRRAFFSFLLLRYERLQNLLFLALIRCFLKFFFMIAMKILVTFAIFATFADFSRPCALFLSSLEFGYVCCSCYSCHICYSVFLDSGFLQALLGLFPF